MDSKDSEVRMALYRFIVKAVYQFEGEGHMENACVGCGRLENQNGIIRHKRRCMWVQGKKALEDE